MLKGYVAANEGTVPAGYSADVRAMAQLTRWALCGIPVLPGVGRDLGSLTKRDLALDVCSVGSATVQAARDAHPAPAVLESPFVGLMVPRVTQKDALRSVALLNTRIDAQGPVTVRLRGVPAGAKAVWRALRRPPRPLELSRDGETVRTTIPEIEAWNAGFVDITE